jgi:ABC-type sugar transport system ATPase subunit
MYEATAITKTYGNVRALSDVSMTIRPGEVHALLGANGAGKSTLMKILAGAEAPTLGSLTLDGLPIQFSNTLQAVDHGIAWVAQELTVYEHLDVLENLYLTRELRRGALVDRAAMRRTARPYLQMVGLDPELKGPLGRLRLGERQRVEICRALLREPRILILDEPTSALDSHETARLFEVVRRLRDSGVAIILVSHFLEDVFSISDVVTVLRDGRRIIDGVPLASVSQTEVVDAMLGERTPVVARDRAAGNRAEFDPHRGLTLSDVTLQGVLEPVDLAVAPGEIVALSGLEGSGSTAIMRILSGQIRADGGRIVMPGGGPPPRDMADAVKKGVAFVPADRGRVGIIASQSVSDNIATVRSLALQLERWMLHPAQNARRAWQRVRQLDIRPERIDLPVGALSGGNQQKVVFAKWLEAGPSLYLLDDPTRGVDVHTRAQMHNVVRELAAGGAVVLIASSDLEEQCAIADRAVVFFHGRAVEEISSENLTPHRLLEAINTGTDAGAPHP